MNLVTEMFTLISVSTYLLPWSSVLANLVSIPIVLILAAVAEDPIAAPASQAYVERIFSLCGLLTACGRNRMHRSLRMRVCLKLNSRVLATSGFDFDGHITD